VLAEIEQQPTQTEEENMAEQKSEEKEMTNTMTNTTEKVIRRSELMKEMGWSAAEYDRLTHAGMPKLRRYFTGKRIGNGYLLSAVKQWLQDNPFRLVKTVRPTRPPKADSPAQQELRPPKADSPAQQELKPRCDDAPQRAVNGEAHLLNRIIKLQEQVIVLQREKIARLQGGAA
jgi:hypothetical protein